MPMILRLEVSGSKQRIAASLLKKIDASFAVDQQAFLAILFSCSKGRCSLEGRTVSVFTEYAPLEYIPDQTRAIDNSDIAYVSHMYSEKSFSFTHLVRRRQYSARSGDEADK